MRYTHDHNLCSRARFNAPLNGVPSSTCDDATEDAEAEEGARKVDHSVLPEPLTDVIISNIEDGYSSDDSRESREAFGGLFVEGIGPTTRTRSVVDPENSIKLLQQSHKTASVIAH